MRSLLVRATYVATRLAGVNALLRRHRSGAVVFCYHNVIASPGTLGDPGLHIALDPFRRQVQWIDDHFEVVPLRELAGRLRRGVSVRRLAAISFDDGYGGVLSNALPWLRERGLPSTIFVTTRATATQAPFWWDLPAQVADAEAPGVRERRLVELEGDGERIRSSDALPAFGPEYLASPWSALLRARGDLVDLEAHSVTHRTLTQLDATELRREFEECADAIEQQAGRRPTQFAYPYGYWDQRVRDAAAAAGYDAAYSLDGGDVELGADPLALPRINIPSAIGMAAFEAWVSGFARLRARGA